MTDPNAGAADLSAEEVARMLYIADEWSGCNGSRWEVMPGHFQHERIRDARDFLDALTTNGYVVVFTGKRTAP